MSEPGFADATVVLLGHGTALDPNSAAVVYQHATALRRKHWFGQVRVAFWKQEPQVSQVLTELQQGKAFVVPLFMSEGHFSENVIPHSLGFSTTGHGERGRIQRSDGRVIVYCRPVGTHPAMTDLVSARAGEVVREFPFPRSPQPQELTLFIAGHGTEQNANSRQAVDAQVTALRTRKVYAAVHAIFLDEDPRISSCYQMAETKNIVVVPFFISEGLHVRQDIPVLLGEPQRLVQQRLQNGQSPWRNPTERHGKLVWYARSVGTEVGVVSVILERVREGAAWLVRTR